MSQKRYPLLRPGSHVISRDTVAAYLVAEQYAVLHDETLTADEKIAGLHALAGLARNLGDHWEQTSRYFGLSARRIWHRQCGLGADGLPKAEMVVRVAQVENPEPAVVVLEPECETDG